MHALMEPFGAAGTLRVVGIQNDPWLIVDPLIDLDISELSPAPEIGWITTDNGKTFSDPTILPLDEIKRRRVNTLTGACQLSIVNGFSSAALGSAHSYPSDKTTQSNLSSLRGSGSDALLLWCADGSGTWSFAAHTAAQVEQVNTDWVAHRQAQQQILASLVEKIDSATTAESVSAVVWPT